MWIAHISYAQPETRLSPYNAVGDTLTVIQTPILNVPAIHIPGETLSIICLAPVNTNNWTAFLIHKHKTIQLQITGVEQLSNPARWQINATIPQVPVYELYDLRVTASGGIDDSTQNAVQIVPTRKSSYYFIHITDSHLPTRIFYPDAGYNSDSTAVDDLRAVIDDINLLNPEFVLFTGDLVNEGELEGFNNMFVYGWAQRLLAELQVPVYLTVGNHDVGGWTSTPPPQGSSRRNWWRYFGWKWLDNADTSWPLHTQDYSFSYGNVHYIALESYDNYDGWRYPIYGAESFTAQQLTWLNTEIGLHPQQTKVLFQHYDFQGQLNLTGLDLDMSLSGHTHSNYGSIYAYPYDLRTRSTCNGNRSYRVIKVDDTTLQPLTTIYAGSNGSNFSVNWYPSNAAVADSVMAIMTNNQPIAFEDTLLRFRMPAGGYTYTATGGQLSQVDYGPLENTVYVTVSIPANNVRYISLKVSGVDVSDDAAAPVPELVKSCYPNPFRDRLNLELASAKAETRIRIYNLRGELVRELDSAVWDSQDGKGTVCPAGVYVIRASRGKQSQSIKVLKY